MDINIAERTDKVMRENGITFDGDGVILVAFGNNEEPLIRLKNFCKRYNCSADYILGLSDRYWGN